MPQKVSTSLGTRLAWCVATPPTRRVREEANLPMSGTGAEEGRKLARPWSPPPYFTPIGRVRMRLFFFLCRFAVRNRSAARFGLW